MLVGHFLQLLLQGGDGVVVVVERFAQMQQAALFGREEKHQPHHHGQRGFVEVRFGMTPFSKVRPLSWSSASNDCTSTSTASRT